MMLDVGLVSNKLSTGIAIVITAAWSISFLVDIIVTTYDPPATLHALMMVVAGAAFSGSIIRRHNGSE